MSNISKVLGTILILIAASAGLNAAVILGPGPEYTVAETLFTAQLDNPLAHLDLIPAYESEPATAAAPARVMNLDPRNVVLGPSCSYAAPRVRARSLGDALFAASAVSLVALNVADYFSTREALRYPGLQEGNPLMKNIVKDPAKFAAVKIGVAVASYFGMKALYKKNRTLGWAVSILSNFAMSYVVSNNLRLINMIKAR